MKKISILLVWSLLWLGACANKNTGDTPAPAVSVSKGVYPLK
jgi:hypothetical protein